MRKRHLAVLLIACAVPIRAQAAVVDTTVQPAVDTPLDRQTLRELSMCLAKQRPAWARQVISYPYLSEAQASGAAEALRGRDHCQQRPDVEMTFRTSTLVSALAEYYLRSSLPNTDSSRLNNALATLPARNTSEDFALCIASHNPAAARELALSDPGSAAEVTSAQALGTQIGSCAQPNENLRVDVQSLRALVTIALYRVVTNLIGS